MRPLLFLCLLLMSTVAVADPAKVTLSCGSIGREFELCRSGAEAWAKQTGNPVEVIAAPNNSSERLAQYQLLLAAGSSDIDVFLVDTAWTGILSDFFIDLKPSLGAGIARYFPASIENDTIHDKLVAIPWFIDAGVLLYRRDLLEKYRVGVPATWKELSLSAWKIQEGERAAGHPHLWGFVFEARAYEGLTCNFLEWLQAFGGGTIIDKTGNVTVNNPDAARALDEAATWIDVISPRGVLNYQEEDARGIFQAGNAVFMRNWPYAWKLANAADSPLKDKVGLARLPLGAPGGSPSGTLGGWSLAVSRYARNPSAATSLVLYLTSAAEQKRRALATGLSPAIPALYDDAELKAAEPELATLLPVFRTAVARPSTIAGIRYNRVSAEVWEAVHRALAGQEPARAALSELQQSLLRIGRNGKW